MGGTLLEAHCPRRDGGMDRWVRSSDVNEGQSLDVLYDPAPVSHWVAWSALMVFGGPSSRSGEDGRDDLAVDVGETAIGSVVPEAQPIEVDAEEMQQGRVLVVAHRLVLGSGI